MNNSFFQIVGVRLAVRSTTKDGYPLELGKGGATQLPPPLQEKAKAFRKLLRAWHPDKNPERAEVAKERISDSDDVWPVSCFSRCWGTGGGIRVGSEGKT